MGEMEKESLERMEDVVKELPVEKREEAIANMLTYGLIYWQGFVAGTMDREKQTMNEARR